MWLTVLQRMKKKARCWPALLFLVGAHSAVADAGSLASLREQCRDGVAAACVEAGYRYLDNKRPAIGKAVIHFRKGCAGAIVWAVSAKGC